MRKPRAYVCVNLRSDGDFSCASRGSRELAARLEALAGDKLQVKRGACLGFCAYGPNIRRDGTGLHIGVTAADLPGIADGTKPSNIGSIGPKPAGEGGETA